MESKNEYNSNDFRNKTKLSNFFCSYDLYSSSLFIFLPKDLIFLLNNALYKIKEGLEMKGFISYDEEKEEIISFGGNKYGQRGMISLPIKPTKFNFAEKILKIGCGQAHTILLMVSKECYSFGKNKYGVLGLGIGIKETVSKPTKINFINPTFIGNTNNNNQNENDALISPILIENIFVGAYHCIVITNKKEEKSTNCFVWGKNDENQLLDLDKIKSQTKPVFIKFPHKIKTIKCGISSTWILTEKRKLLTNRCCILNSSYKGNLIFSNLNHTIYEPFKFDENYIIENFEIENRSIFIFINLRDNSVYCCPNGHIKYRHNKEEKLKAWKNHFFRFHFESTERIEKIISGSYQSWFQFYLKNPFEPEKETFYKFITNGNEKYFPVTLKKKIIDIVPCEEIFFIFVSNEINGKFKIYTLSAKNKIFYYPTPKSYSKEVIFEEKAVLFDSNGFEIKKIITSKFSNHCFGIAKKNYLV